MPSVIHGEPRCPEALTKFLRNVGGETPFHQNKYRVSHTDTVYTQRGGEWHDWDKNLSINERGGMVQTPAGLLVPSQYKPDRVVAELREFLKYAAIPGKWVLEFWCPASYYGSRELWEQKTVPNHPEIPLLGAYPERGDYELISAPLAELPTESNLLEAIQRHNWNKEHEIRGQLEKVVEQRTRDAMREYEEEQARWQAETELKVKDVLLSLSTCSLEAGRHRQQLADAAGLREHAGA